jgi:outer membrane protein
MRSICVRALVTALVAAALAMPAPCLSADEAAGGSGDVFQFRVRAVYLEPSNPVIPAGPSMGGKAYPEVSGDWFLAPGWSTELSIGVPTANFALPDSGGMGIRLMPFTGTLQRHFLPESRIQPYLGAGVQYTRATLTNVPQSTYVSGENTFGFVAQAGADLRAGPTWSVNADIRYLGGLAPNGYKIDPFLYSLGITFRY